MLIDMIKDYFLPDIVIPGYDSLDWVSYHIYVNRHIISISIRKSAEAPYNYNQIKSNIIRKKVFMN